MAKAFEIWCDSSDLAIECENVASSVGLLVEPHYAASPVEEAVASRAPERHIAFALTLAPEIEHLINLSKSHPISLLAILKSDRTSLTLRDLARDLGLVAVDEIRPLIAAVGLRVVGAEKPWSGSIRHVHPAQRIRLQPYIVGNQEKLRYQSAQSSFVVAERERRSSCLGEARDVAIAIDAFYQSHAGRTHRRPGRPQVEGVNLEVVADVLFGPERALSDPASKQALSAYDLPFPNEELCTSPSRAAAEATRIGFPVRIALASPDLRIWDHPELAADGVDNAARVRDVYRQITALAKARTPGARILGVTVSATSPAHALLWLKARALNTGEVHMSLGFSDPHGIATEDRLETVLPASVEQLECTLSRLQGNSLLSAERYRDQQDSISNIHDVLLRLTAFTQDFDDKVRSVEVDPVALLVGGGIELREVCIEVGDAYERTIHGTVDIDSGD